MSPSTTNAPTPTSLQDSRGGSLVPVVVFGHAVSPNPMAELVVVMLVVAAATFDWRSDRASTLRRMPKTETFEMVTTAAVVVATGNLAIGVIISMVVFARRVAHVVNVTASDGPTPEARLYKVRGSSSSPRATT